MMQLTHYQTTNIRLFQTKKVCRRQFQIWQKWQKVLKTSRKHCGKRRNARYKQFLLFPQCFQKACFPGASKGVVVWEWANDDNKADGDDDADSYTRAISIDYFFLKTADKLNKVV